MFSHLDVKDLLENAQVSTKFRQILQDTSFWKCFNFTIFNTSIRNIKNISRFELCFRLKVGKSQKVIFDLVPSSNEPNQYHSSRTNVKYPIAPHGLLE